MSLQFPLRPRIRDGARFAPTDHHLDGLGSLGLASSSHHFVVQASGAHVSVAVVAVDDGDKVFFCLTAFAIGAFELDRALAYVVCCRGPAEALLASEDLDVDVVGGVEFCSFEPTAMPRCENEEEGVAFA